MVGHMNVKNIRLACWIETPCRWHLGAETCSTLILVINCIVLGAFVGYCINWPI